ncbi:hypothetical protein ACIBO5_58970 [Nonomuraea angiospora]|uniref:hypothetical protein n=1 Tax=Nonomuraea angiospora TaxID=46172 RepID=UPI0029AD3A5A|nr:hypothetical protein [Nonomuraea angiospora]MDX3100928.1 hypothetical protein [Nonomuraea angiospora]
MDLVTPGLTALSSTRGPVLENEARASESSMAPTVSAASALPLEPRRIYGAQPDDDRPERSPSEARITHEVN